MKWMVLPYQRYFDFSGRSRRLEYWMFTLFFSLVCIFFVIVMVTGLANAGAETNRMPGPTFWVGCGGLILFFLASLIPYIAVSVRRFHDQDRSGWMYLLFFIPNIGNIVVLVFMCIDGTSGENRFGYDPKGRGEAGIAEVFA